MRLFNYIGNYDKVMLIVVERNKKLLIITMLLDSGETISFGDARLSCFHGWSKRFLYRYEKIFQDQRDHKFKRERNQSFDKKRDGNVPASTQRHDEGSSCDADICTALRKLRGVSAGVRYNDDCFYLSTNRMISATCIPDIC